MGQSATYEQRAWSVMLPVAEAGGNVAVAFHEAVDRVGSDVVRATGVEVGQERLPSLLSVLLSRLISAVGQVGSDARTVSAVGRPSTGFLALSAKGSCSAHSQVTSSSSWRSPGRAVLFAAR